MINKVLTVSGEYFGSLPEYSWFDSMVRFLVNVYNSQSVELRKKHAINMYNKMMVKACVTCAGNCNICSYYDECSTSGIPAVNVECIKLELCESRHVIPGIDGSVFKNTLDPTNVNIIRVDCEKSLGQKVLDNGIEYLVLYVTGLSVALVEVINWCIRHNVHLTLMHYNKDTGKYYHQDLQWQ